MLDYLPLLDPGINQNKHHVERIPNLRGFSGTHWCPQKHVQMQLLDRTVNCLHSGHPTSCKNFTGGPSFPFPKVQMVVSASLSPPIPIPNFPPKPPPFVRACVWWNSSSRTVFCKRSSSSKRFTLLKALWWSSCSMRSLNWRKIGSKVSPSTRWLEEKGSGVKVTVTS